MKAVVVGGGISGLALARELRLGGVDPLVLEAGPRAGGKVRSERVQGFLCESGPTSFLDDGAVVALARALGVEGGIIDASPSARRRFLAVSGALHEVPSSPPALLRTRLLPLRAKLRALGEVFVARGNGAEESVAAFARRRVGRAVADRFVGAMVAGIYAGDAEALSLPAAFPRAAAIEREHRSLLLGARAAGLRARPVRSFGDGMQTITDALSRHLGGALRYGAVLRALEPGPHGGWRVRLSDGEIDADAVILALPAHDAARAVAALDAPLADVLDAILYAPVAVVHVGWPLGALPRPAEGFGFLVPPSEPTRVLGAIFASNVFPGRAPDGAALFSAMVGGTRHPDRAALPDDALVELVRTDLGVLLGVTAEPSFARVIRHERAIPQYTLGHLARVAAVEAAEARHPGLFFAGNAYRGVSLPDCVRDAARVAERVMRGL